MVFDKSPAGGALAIFDMAGSEGSFLAGAGGLTEDDLDIADTAVVALATLLIF